MKIVTHRQMQITTLKYENVKMSEAKHALRGRISVFVYYVFFSFCIVQPKSLERLYKHRNS